MKSKFPLGALCLFSFSCSVEFTSQTSIDSGLRVKPDEAKGVYLLRSGCTATAVSSSTLITAAHCLVKDGCQQRRVCTKVIDPRSGAILMGHARCTSNVAVPEEFFDTEGDKVKDHFWYDIAVAVFPSGTFSHFHALSNAELRSRDAVTLVGFSPANNPEPQNGNKRWGRNAVSSIEPGGVVITKYTESSDGVAVSPGDSGGPLLKGCRLAGVASRMRFMGSKKESMHTSILENADFLKGVDGAYYCGLSGSDSSQCPLSGQSKLQSGAKEAFPCS